MKKLTSEELELNLKAATDAKDTNHMAAVFYVALTELLDLRVMSEDLLSALNRIVTIADSSAPADERVAEMARTARNRLPE